MEKLPIVDIYTDGACSGNPGPGGWAAIIRSGSTEKVLTGGAKQTTNNRMEMAAALAALQALTKPCTVNLHTDSKYLIGGLTEWMPGWLKRGWKNSQGKKVENQDLWQELNEAVKPHKINTIWVKGHAGHDENERVDKLAVKAIDKFR